MTGYIDLSNYYQLNFNLVFSKYYSLLEIDAMYPYERDIYSELLLHELGKKEEQ